MERDILDQLLPKRLVLTAHDLAVAFVLDDRTIRRRAELGEFAGAFKVGRDWRFMRQALLDRPPICVVA